MLGKGDVTGKIVLVRNESSLEAGAARRAPAHVWARDDHDGHCALDGDEQARAEREPGPERHGATP